MDNVRVNIAFRNSKIHRDSSARAEHVFDRMRLRGISIENIREAVQKGAKQIRADNSIISEFRWFKVVYKEFRISDVRKIYPITVLDGRG